MSTSTITASRQTTRNEKYDEHLFTSSHRSVCQLSAPNITLSGLAKHNKAGLHWVRKFYLCTDLVSGQNEIYFEQNIYA